MSAAQRDTRTLFKWLGAEGEPHHGGRGVWPLPQKQANGTWKPGAPLAIRGALIPCRRGLHLCRESDLIAWCAPTLWVAQYRGEILEVDDKVVVREARLLQQLETWNDRTARLLAADCAERALLLTKTEERRCWDAVVVARRYAIGQASEDDLATAWDAAGYAPRDAARYAAWAAARYAAWAAARDAAGDAAKAAAWAAAWDAARAAERRWQTARLLAYLRGETPPPVTVDAHSEAA